MRWRNHKHDNFGSNQPLSSPSLGLKLPSFLVRELYFFPQSRGVVLDKLEVRGFPFVKNDDLIAVNDRPAAQRHPHLVQDAILSDQMVFHALEIIPCFVKAEKQDSDPCLPKA
jgi:hypothetical protein